MSTHRISHIALHVESLRQAVTFYARLFDLQALHEAPPADSGEPDPLAPADPGGPRDTEGARPDGCLLGRGDFRLLLRPGASEPGADGRLAHVGLETLAGDLEALAGRAARLGCRVARQGADRVHLEDVYGVRWIVTAEAAAERGAAEPEHDR